MTTQTRAINAAAGVIHAAMQQGKTIPTGIAFALDSAGLLNSPETAAELLTLRARVAELEAAATQARTEAIADVGDWLDEVGQKNAAYLVYTSDIPAARDMRSVSAELPEALHASSGAVIETTRVDGVSPHVADLRALVARQAEDRHDSPLHHPYELGRDLPEPGVRP